jgi:acetoin utilization deacetylase AcuC-like enzyme
MKIFHTDHFTLPLPDGHRFPMGKYALLTRRVVDAGLDGTCTLLVPDGARDADIERVHDPTYWSRVKHGQLAHQEVRRIGLPWSPQLVERARRSCGGTIAACRAAIGDGCSVNLAGGTHHAFGDHGSGYCVLNDSAISGRAAQSERLGC